jgi:hypothetical protein
MLYVIMTHPESKPSSSKTTLKEDKEKEKQSNQIRTFHLDRSVENFYNRIYHISIQNKTERAAEWTGISTFITIAIETVILASIWDVK